MCWPSYINRLNNANIYSPSPRNLEMAMKDALTGRRARYPNGVSDDCPLWSESVQWAEAAVTRDKVAHTRSVLPDPHTLGRISRRQRIYIPLSPRPLRATLIRFRKFCKCENVHLPHSAMKFPIHFCDEWVLLLFLFFSCFTLAWTTLFQNRELDSCAASRSPRGPAGRITSPVCHQPPAQPWRKSQIEESSIRRSRWKQLKESSKWFWKKFNFKASYPGPSDFGMLLHYSASPNLESMPNTYSPFASYATWATTWSMIFSPPIVIKRWGNFACYSSSIFNPFVQCLVETPTVFQRIFRPAEDCSVCQDVQQVEKLANVKPQVFEEQ